MNKWNFIFTKSEDTASYLLSVGYSLINHTDDGWFFLKDDRLSFSDTENAIFTNKLFV